MNLIQPSVHIVRKWLFCRSNRFRAVCVFILLGMITLPHFLSAQCSYYTFSSSTDTYTTLTSAIELIAENANDELSTSTSIGFTFTFNGIEYTEFKVCSNGWINLGGSLTGTYATNTLSTTEVLEVIAPLWDDLQVNSGGSIGYELSGSSGSYVLTVEFKDMDFAGYGTSLNFQVKLYEAEADEHKMEFCYGDMGSWSGQSASIGLIDEASNSFVSVTPGSPPSSSSVTANNGISSHTYLTDGLKYTFAAGSDWLWWKGKSTDWTANNNWKGGAAPDLEKNVSIPGGKSFYPIIVSGDNAKTDDLNINQGGNIVIASDGNLTVSGTLRNSDNTTLVIQSTSASLTGSLIFTSGTPNATIQRYLTDNMWHLISPSTTGVTADDFYWSDSPKSWLTYHTESTNEWTYNTSLATSMPVGQGWAVWLDNSAKSDATATMTGDLRVSDLSVSLTKGGDGWNLIGNPFASAIDWDEGTWGNNSTGTVYVWDYDYNSGDYRTWNGSTGDLTDGIIPISQGFFVQASSVGSFAIPTGARVHNSQSFYKSAVNTENSAPYFRIQLDHEIFGNTVFLGFPENGTANFDYQGDAGKLISSLEKPQIFVVENDINLSTNALAPLTESGITVPLHLIQVIDGPYTLTLDNYNNISDIKITLEDLKTSHLQDFTSNPHYAFTALSDDNPDRFLLHCKSTTFGVDNPNINLPNMQIYSVEKNIYIHSSGKASNQVGKVMVYDIAGRLLDEQQIGKGDLVNVPVNVSNTYLIVRVIKESNVKTEKVFIN